MGIVAANLRDWEQQPRNWRVLEPVNDPDHERYYRHNDTPALRVQVANRLETLLKAWDGKDETDYSGDCTLQPTTIAKIVETCLDDYEVLATSGADPLADRSTDRFAPLAEERAHPHPHRSENAYPHAFDQIAQLFDHPAAPDLCVIHSASHNWEDQGGHRGEHGGALPPGFLLERAPWVFSVQRHRRIRLLR